MASIIPHQVFGEIMEIARSDDPLQSRCQRTERRIAQFKTDQSSLREPDPREALKNPSRP
jgi:hypothetical protein